MPRWLAKNRALRGLALALRAGVLSCAFTGGATAQPQEAPVEIVLTGTQGALFPALGTPETITVRARKTEDVPGSLQCRVILDTLTGAPTSGYTATAPVTLELATPGEWVTATLQIGVEQGAPRMTTGKLLVKGAVGKRAVRRDVPLRVGWGALAFRERRKVQFADGIKDTDVVCLENRHLRAELLPELGTLITLMSHQDRQDLLVSGDYAVGLAWGGVCDWFNSTMPLPGPRVIAEFIGRSQGQVVLLRASLGEEDQALSLELDCGDLPLAPGPVTLTTAFGVAGEDCSLVPADGGGSSAVLDATRRSVPLEGAGPWRFGLWDARRDLTLWAEFASPAFTTLELAQSAPWCDYATLKPGTQPPGKVQVRLWTARGRGGNAPATAATTGDTQ